MASAIQIITKVTFIILKAAEDCCKKWRQKNERKEPTGKQQLTGSSSCTNMKCYSEIQTKTWSSVAFQIVLLNNAIKTCHLDHLTLSTSLAYLIFHAIFSLPSLVRIVHFSRAGRGVGSGDGTGQQKGPQELLLLIAKPTNKQNRCSTMTSQV